MKINENGNVTVCFLHEYYFQIQMQMQLTETFFGDLVVWHPEELFVVRITRDENFWVTEYPKTISFFYDVIMPELLGKLYTRNSINV